MNDVVVFTGGGTGGHVFPGLAVVEELLRRWDGKAVWIGSSNGIENHILKNAGFPFYGIAAGKLRRYFSFRNCTDVFRVILGWFQALHILKRLSPVLVFSKGGYVSVPVVYAARCLGIPVITHESDYDPGLATRMNSLVAGRILVAYQDTVGYFPDSRKTRVTVTGNPVRRAVLEGDGLRGKALIGVSPETSVVLFLGGSLGAEQINDLVDEIIKDLSQRVFVVHQTGDASEAAGHGNNNNYLRKSFFGQEYPDILAAADLVVCRAGAGTLWEAAVLGRPAVLIPLGRDGSRGDQLRNAELFHKIGGMTVLSPEQQNPADLLRVIYSLLDDQDRRDSISAALCDMVGGNAAETITGIIEDVIETRKDRKGGHRWM
jgi:UDP-N-acetylglucosamine--N-acetylmuramyl-(pentapeptide) pyrophosphoryl-undecaprenol N-acetylglucosamine transferase